MNPDSEIELDFPPFFRVYKGGRFEDLHGTGVDVQGTGEATADIPSEDVTIDANTTARIYRPGLTDTAQSKLPILIYFHGGAFLFGSYSIPTYDNHLRILVSRAQLVAVSVDYRLANQARLPAAYEDSWAALKWVVSRAHPWLAEHGDFDRMFVAGDSAGANITHHLALQAGVEGVKIKGVGLIHPYFWGEKRIESETWLPIVRETIRTLWTMVMPEEESWDLDHHWINPLHEGAPSLAGLGCERAMVCVASFDPLQARGKAYRVAAEASEWGGEAELVESIGGHCFHLADPSTDEAKKLVDKLVAFFSRA